MTNNINGIDVSECPCKDDDKCLEVPILNEYGDLIDYQDCEPQTLCPYRSKTKIQRLQEENEGLKSLNDFNVQKIEVLQEENEKLYKALEEIRKKITPVCAYCNNIDGFTTWDDCENVCEKGVIKYLKIIDEALNEQK